MDDIYERILGYSNSDVLYVDELIGPNTVNTVPPKTLVSFNDHGTVESKIEDNIEDAKLSMSELEALGISMSDATNQLEEEGVASFSKAFEELIS